MHIDHAPSHHDDASCLLLLAAWYADIRKFGRAGLQAAAGYKRVITMMSHERARSQMKPEGKQKIYRIV